MSIILMSNVVPRRNRIDLNTPAEMAIRAAVDAVEILRADSRLTEIVLMLDRAREKLADFVDDEAAVQVTP